MQGQKANRAYKTQHLALKEEEEEEEEHPCPNSIQHDDALSSIKNWSALFFSVQCSVLVFSPLSKFNSGNSWQWHYDDDSGLHMKKV